MKIDYEIISGSMLKVLRHEAFFYRKKTPISVQFVLTNRCNLRCVFCVNRNKKTSYKDVNALTDEQIIKAINDLKELGVKGIEFTGGGEPLLHKSFCKIIDYTISCGITPALVTNGTLLSEISKDVLKCLDWIRISINSGRSSYKKIHGVDKYDDVLRGLETINDLDISNKGVSHIFCHSSNLKDSQELLDDLQKFNLNYFRFSVDVLDNKLKIDSKILRSEKIPIIDHSNRQKQIPKKCFIFYYKPVIDYNGDIYPCCVSLYKSKMKLGHVEEIKNIILNKNIDLDTSSCPYCIYGDINNLINDMDKPIKNENFI